MSISPIQAARAEIAQAKPNMNVRLASSIKLVTAFNNFDANLKGGYFEKNLQKISDLVVKTQILSKAIATVAENNEDAGTCKITVPGRFFDTRKVERIADVNAEIQRNLDNEVVKFGLEALGIIKPEQPVVESRSSIGAFVKAGVATLGLAAASGVGAAMHYGKIPGLFTYAQAEKTLVQAQGKLNEALTYAKTAYASVQMPKQVIDLANTIRTQSGMFKKQAVDFGAQAIGVGSQAVKFVSANRKEFAIGAGVALAVGGAAVAAYKYAQNRKEPVKEQEPTKEQEPVKQVGRLTRFCQRMMQPVKI